MTVYVYVSVCDFVCIVLLLPFVLGFCLSVFVVVLVVVVLVEFLTPIIIGGFVFCFGCSLLSFSFFITF